MQPEDQRPDPSQVDNITNIETERMMLRWALERLRSLEKTCAEQENRAETEASLRLQAERESETLRQGQRELYYKKLEDFIALHLTGKQGLPAPAQSAPIVPPPAAPSAPALEQQRAKAPPREPQPDERRARTDKGAFTLAELEGARAFARLADVARALKGQVDRLQAERAQSEALAAADATRARQALDESLAARRSLERDLAALRARPNSMEDPRAESEDRAQAEREAAQARRERDEAERGRELAARDLAEARRQRDQALMDLEQARRELEQARRELEQARRDMEQESRSAERAASVPASEAPSEAELARLQELELDLARQYAEKTAALEGLKKQFGEQIERWLAGEPAA